MRKLKVLLACEESQRVCIEFRKMGHYAYSCDLLPCSGGHPEWHLQEDVRNFLNNRWDMIIAFPPCTYLCSSGLHWNKRIPGRQELTDDALEFVRQILFAPVHYIALENPVGCISTQIRPADQYIQPYQFGEDASKKTGLWLKNLPLLKPTSYYPPRIVKGKKLWSNQTDSGQNRLGPSETRAIERSKTYVGIAKAMANQWGNII
jgi:hypothetical protein